MKSPCDPNFPEAGRANFDVGGYMKSTVIVGSRTGCVSGQSPRAEYAMCRL